MNTVDKLINHATQIQSLLVEINLILQSADTDAPGKTYRAIDARLRGLIQTCESMKNVNADLAVPS